MIPKLASLVQTMFTLMLFASLPATGGVLQATPLPAAAFAQTSPSSSSLADKIIEETATSVQDSSSDDNLLEDNNQFGDEAAAIEQDNAEDQEDANVGAQNQDEVQEQDAAQDAANTNFDLDVQEGIQQELPPPTPTEPPTEPEPVFCFVSDAGAVLCFDTLEECEQADPVIDCERFEEPPPGSLSCRLEGQVIVCEV